MVFEALEPFSLGFVLAIFCGFIGFGARAALERFEAGVFPDLGDD